MPVDSNEKIYDFRFNSSQDQKREEIWKILIETFFQKLIPSSSILVDLGCGRGEFLGQISAQRRIGIDRENLLRQHYRNRIEFFVSVNSNWTFLENESVDTVFASNVFEHFESKKELDGTLAEIRRVLRKGAQLIVLTPNIRLEPKRYWDYYDHHIPLTDRSVEEALVKAGFTLKRTIVRFLPWSTDSRVPFSKMLLRVYLRLPFLWRIVGKQSLVIGIK